MSIHALSDEPARRSRVMLRTALGPLICAWLEADDVIEIMLNPDGRLWLERLGGCVQDTGRNMAASEAERIVRLAAHHVGVEAHAGNPRVSAELPGGGERFEGLLPPVVAAPTFAIRKPAVRSISLSAYEEAGVMTSGQAQALRLALGQRRNILVAGGASSGKTTLTNAVLGELSGRDERVVLIEDTVELKCPAANTVALRSKEGVASLRDLLRSTLRLRPDRIIVGEVRGAEALDLVKAWGTGHPGGVATLHAGTALGALRRLEQLIQETVSQAPCELIAETIDVIAVLSRQDGVRRLTELCAVSGFEAGAYQLSPLGDDQ